MSVCQGRTVWSYHSEDHILDIMIKPSYFAALADKLSEGDVILVDCPGYYALERFLGYPQRSIHRPGGGVLQVEQPSAPGQVSLRIVGRGLRRFVKAGEDGMSDVLVPAPSRGIVSDRPPEPDRDAEKRA